MALTKVKGHILADDIALGGNPTTSTQSTGNNTTRIATTAFVQTELAALIDSSPSSLNTLNELAAALGDDANFSTTVTNSIATKLPLAGGTMTGSILIDSSSSASIGLDRGNDTSGSTVDFKTGGTLKWYMGLRGLSNDNFYLRNEAGSTDALTILTNGKVGIGTSSPNALLHIKTADPATNQAVIDFRNPTYGIFAQTNSISSRGNTLEFIASDYNSNSPTTHNVLTIRPEGNVGIGTNNPSTNLDVYNSGGWGTIHIDGTSGGELAFQKAGTRYGGLYASNSHGLVVEAAAGTNSILFLTSSTERMRIDSSGNVGIGVSPTKALSVKAGSGSNGGIDVFHNNGNKVAELVHHGSGDEGRLSLYDGGVNTVLLHGENGQISYINSGKVVIGDTASHTDDLLQIETPASGGGHGIQIRRNDSNSDQGIGHIQFGNNTDTDLAKIAATTDGGSDNARLSFHTQPDSGSLTERLRITHDGHVMFNTAANAGFKYFMINQVNDGALIFKYNNADKWQQSLDSSTYDKMFYSYTAGRHVYKMHADGRDFDFTSDTANDYTPRINLYSKSSGAYAGEINFYSKHNSNEWVCASIFATGGAGYGTGNPPNGGMRLYIRGAYGDTHALNALDINGNGVISGDLNDTSDVALKKDIVSLNASDSLTAIKALNPVSFKWKLDDEKRSGFIAQEVEEHLPNDVIGEDWRAEVKGEEGDPSSRDEGSKGKAVNSTGILAHAVKVIQEQQAAIEDLQSRIATLEG